MRIYQPATGVGPAPREDSFIVIDDAGIEIGRGAVIYRLVKKMYPDRPLDVEMILNAHPMARDTLYGALSARAERIKAEKGEVAARLYTRCALDDQEKHDYFVNLGFDDFDGLELFVLKVPATEGRRRNYSPMGTQVIDTDLSTRPRREEFLLRLKDFGDVEHAAEWLNARMQENVFIAKSVYAGSDYVGSLLITGNQKEAMMQMVGVEPKWRGKGVATAMIEEAAMQLTRQQVPFLVSRVVRRNTSAIRLMKRCGFEWIQTEELLLGKNY